MRVVPGAFRLIRFRSILDRAACSPQALVRCRNHWWNVHWLLRQDIGAPLDARSLQPLASSSSILAKSFRVLSQHRRSCFVTCLTAPVAESLVSDSLQLFHRIPCSQCVQHESKNPGSVGGTLVVPDGRIQSTQISVHSRIHQRIRTSGELTTNSVQAQVTPSVRDMVTR
jgi:hypothetical protein